MRKMHLICNAHLDPVWLWRKAEAMGEAISTFTVAANFCEKYDGFVFNHNESVLYEWIKENDFELFERIKELVKQKKWIIPGGWYVQPDVLMPCGESIIRQIRVGNKFFEKHLGEVQKTAIGFDAFGHSRGLVQILKKCGYENYVFLRPREMKCEPFIWEGFDGSKVCAYKLYEWYNTPKGEALERVKAYNKDFGDRKINALTWGIGNHGGGPSEKDLNDINDYIDGCDDTEIVHSEFDSYFNELNKDGLNTKSESLVHCFVGCYTTMALVKQGHRRLESILSLCEKMLCLSEIEYNEKDFEDAEKALLFIEFHDILPGTAIKKAEADSLNLIGYGIEIAERLVWKSFIHMCKGQKKAVDGEIPIMIYNPHPYEIISDFEVEFQMAEQNHPDNGIYDIDIVDESGKTVSCQLEQEDSAHGMDWRKKAVFYTKAAPMSITRLNCRLKLNKGFVKVKPYNETNNNIVLENKSLYIEIDKHTGKLNKYICDGINVINSLDIRVYKDSADPWGMETDAFDEYIGVFKPSRSAIVTENGDVRTKVQTFWKYSKSSAVITYIFSKNSRHLDVNIKMLSGDENIMYKLCINTNLDESCDAYCQTMFGTEKTRKEGKESVFQKWCAIKDSENMIAVLNAGTYGGSFKDNEIRLSLLRTPVYSAHPVAGVELAPNDRAYDHIDIGERNFDFSICINEPFVDCEAEIFNQKPLTLALFPQGNGDVIENGVYIDNKFIVLSALKKCEGNVLIRLYNSSSDRQKAMLSVLNKSFDIEFKPFEVKTFVLREEGLQKVDMLGKIIKDDE